MTLRIMGAGRDRRALRRGLDRAAEAWRPARRRPALRGGDPVAAQHAGLPLPAAGRPAELADDANLYAREALSASGEAVVAGTKVDGRQLPEVHPAQPRDVDAETSPHVLDLIAGHAGAATLERTLATMTHVRLHRHRPGPVQPRPGLPDRADRRLDGLFLEASPDFELAPRHVAGRDPPADAVHGRPGHPGRPDLAVLVPQLPEGVRPAVLVLHPGELLSAAQRVQRLLPLGRGQAAQPPLRHDGDPVSRTTDGGCTVRARQRRGRVPRPPPGPRHRHPAVHPGRLPGPGRRPGAQLALPGEPGRAAGQAQHHGRRQRPERRGDLPRPARRHRRPRLPAELGHPLAAVLPAGVHQADAGDDLTGVRGLLPRAARGSPLPAGDSSRRACSRASTPI